MNKKNISSRRIYMKTRISLVIMFMLAFMLPVAMLMIA